MVLKTIWHRFVPFCGEWLQPSGMAYEIGDSRWVVSSWLSFEFPARSVNDSVLWLQIGMIWLEETCLKDLMRLAIIFWLSSSAWMQQARLLLAIFNFCNFMPFLDWGTVSLSVLGFIGVIWELREVTLKIWGRIICSEILKWPLLICSIFCELTVSICIPWFCDACGLLHSLYFLGSIGY